MENATFKQTHPQKGAELKRESNRHLEELARHQWTEVCASINGKLGVGGPWDLLKHLLDSQNQLRNQRLAVDRIIHRKKMAGIVDADLVQDLANRYLPMGPADDADYPEYQGADITELDSPFWEQEIWTANKD